MTHWPALIQGLRQAGLRYIDIAAHCGRTEQWVSSIVVGRIKHASGEPAELLIGLYRQQFPGMAIPRVKIALGSAVDALGAHAEGLPTGGAQSAARD